MLVLVKITESIDVFACGSFPNSPAWTKAVADVEAAVLATDWPHGSGSFTIYPEKADTKKKLRGNGVVPIKYPCLDHLTNHGWRTEQLPVIVDGVLGTGDLDAVYDSPDGCIAFEWETGNISSSHRAINKLLMGLKYGGIKGGILVVPSDKMKVWLTDRIGNIGELRPYFRLWDDAKLHDDNGVLRIVVCEHDFESVEVPRIPKGQDGNALRAKVRRLLQGGKKINKKKSGS